MKGLRASTYATEDKRRLLYNAITRAQDKVKLIIIGSKAEADRDAALSLLVRPAQ